MRCPTCNVALVPTERQGVEIDYCPKCRGIWLDRGELDRIIERSSASSASRGREGQPYDHHTGSPRTGWGDDDYRKREHDQEDYRGRKREGLLDELFDLG